jgi:DNA-binding response OmpR family regulator
MNRILVVEDEEFLIRALVDNFEAEGFSVDSAQNGDEAIKQIQKQKPSIVLLDLLLPKKDGFAVLKDMKANPEWSLIPVIVLSNLGGDEQIKRALELGADDYFVKSQHPIEEVVEKVRGYLEGNMPTKISS